MLNSKIKSVFISNLSSKVKQYWISGIIGGLPGICYGLVLGYSAVLLPDLSDKNLSIDEKSWIASLTSIMPSLGSILIGLLTHKIGRRYSLMTCLICLLIGWIIIGLSQKHFLILCIGRSFQGLGMIISICQLYIVEISETCYRDVTSSFPAISLNIGITLIYILGAIFENWQYVALSGALITIFALIMILIGQVPESPYWLIQHGKFKKAEMAITHIRGNEFTKDKDAIDKEINDMQRTINEDSSQLLSLKDQFRQLISEEEVYKPLIILVILQFLVQSTGNYAITFYTIDVFNSLLTSSSDRTTNNRNKNDFHTYYAAINVGVFRILSSIIGIWIIKKFLRRQIIITSSLFMGFFLAITMFMESIKENVFDNQGGSKWILDYVPIISTSGYILSFGVGLNIIPFLLVGELCPARVKNITSSIAFATTGIAVFTIVKSYPFMIENIGTHWTYLIYTSFCIILALYTYLVVPETRNISIKELQDMYKKKKPEEKSRTLKNDHVEENNGSFTL